MTTPFLEEAEPTSSEKEKVQPLSQEWATNLVLRYFNEQKNKKNIDKRQESLYQFIREDSETKEEPELNSPRYEY